MYIRNCLWLRVDCEWDPDKSLLNQTNQGCAFDIVTGFGWEAAIKALDDRFDYGEERWLAIPHERNAEAGRWPLGQIGERCQSRIAKCRHKGCAVADTNSQSQKGMNTPHLRKPIPAFWAARGWDLSGGRGKGKSFFVAQRVEEKPELLFQAQHNRVCRTFVRQRDACLASRDRALMIGAKKGQAIMRKLEPSRSKSRS